MESADVGLIIILTICTIGLFAVLLFSRMRKETRTRASTSDDALNYGRGTMALAAIRAQTTGLSTTTVWMLIIAGLMGLGAGLALMYAELILLGIGFAAISFASVVI